MKLEDPQVSTGFSTKSWSDNLDDLGEPQLRKPSLMEIVNGIYKIQSVIFDPYFFD